MSVLLFALALFAQGPADPGTVEAAPAAAEAPYPVGAPKDDYLLVSWCYGALRGYLELHDQVMPEVTRIETTWRRPGSNLSEDLKVYGDMQREGQRNLKLFQRAMTAAEKASLRPLNAAGAEAIKKGRGVWTGAPSVSKSRLAQEWMSWSLPARCIPTAEALEKRSLLAGPALKANAPAEPPPESLSPETPAPETPAEDAAPLVSDPAAPGPQSVDELLDAGLAPETPPAVAAAPAEESVQP